MSIPTAPKPDIAQPSLADRLLARLARVTSSGAFITEIDGLRFFAIAAVIAFHVYFHIKDSLGYLPRVVPTAGESLPHNAACCVNYLFSKGYIGVDLFFVISGFILSLPFAAHYLTGKSLPVLGKYYLRRVTRLEPPYFIALFLALAYVLWVDRMPFATVQPHFISSLFYLHQFHYADSPKAINLVNGALWSLECEVQFYLLAPLLARLFTIRRPWVRRAAIFLLPYCVNEAVYILRLIPGPYQIGVFADRFNLLPYLGLFMAGFLMADIYLTELPSQQRRLSWDIYALVAAAELVWLTTGIDSKWASMRLYLFIYPPLILVIYLAAFRGIVLNAIVRNRWRRPSGGCATAFTFTISSSSSGCCRIPSD